MSQPESTPTPPPTMETTDWFRFADGKFTPIREPEWVAVSAAAENGEWERMTEAAGLYNTRAYGDDIDWLFCCDVYQKLRSFPGYSLPDLYWVVAFAGNPCYTVEILTFVDLLEFLRLYVYPMIVAEVAEDTRRMREKAREADRKRRKRRVPDDDYEDVDG